MTRLLDRYLLGIFLPALAMFSVTLLVLFVAVDFAPKIGRFLELKKPLNMPLLQFVLYFYYIRIPMLVSMLLPAVMLFAPTFTVIKLARANEILPIAAAGISLRRMSLPFVVFAFLTTAAMMALDEYVLPPLGDPITVTDEIVNSRGFTSNSEDYDGRTKIWVQRYDPGPRELKEAVRASRLNDEMQPIEQIVAKRGVWDAAAQKWRLFDGTVDFPTEIEYPLGQKPRTKRIVIPPEGYLLESKLTPDTLRRSSALTSRFSFMKLKDVLDQQKKFPNVPSCVLKVHFRFSFPLAPVVLLLVGLPFVVDPNSKSFVKGLIFCFILAIGYYLTHFSCVDLGNRGAIPPLWAAWTPTAGFGLVGLVSFCRMRT